MSLPKLTELPRMGMITGGVYDFEKAGDIVPKHNHDEHQAHITIVARGSIKAYSHDWEKIIPLGGCVDFPAGQPHEFMALEDNTRIFNLIKFPGGKPYVSDLSEEEMLKMDEEIMRHTEVIKL